MALVFFFLKNKSKLGKNPSINTLFDYVVKTAIIPAAGKTLGHEEEPGSFGIMPDRWGDCHRQNGLENCVKYY